MGSVKATPMIKQYLSIKQQYGDAILFYRMGDFYEMFFEDAEKAAAVLEIALTSRNKNDESPIPMCGVPAKAADAYIGRLIEGGYKVAVCDQTEDPAAARGLVKRAVTRVLTPGTVVEESSLKAGESNYLASLYWDEQKNRGALAWADFSTGYWTGLDVKNIHEIWQWLYKLEPAEILAPQGFQIPAEHRTLKRRFNHVPAASFFDQRSGLEMILRDQKAASAEVLDLQDRPDLIRVCGAILMYLVHTHKGSLGHMGEFRPLVQGAYLQLDEVTIRNLEIFKTLGGSKGPGTLIHALDQTCTPMGGRYLQKRLGRPWKNLSTINEHQDMVDFFLNRDPLRKKIRECFSRAFDLERVSSRIALNRCLPRDFISLKSSLSVLPELESLLKAESEQPRLLSRMLSSWDNLEEVCSTVSKAIQDNPSQLITEGGIFKKGYDFRLDQLIDMSEHGRDKLVHLLEKERSAHDLPKLKMGYNRVFGHYFELSRSSDRKLPEHFERRQTLVNSERYVTSELKELEENLASASDERKAREYELFNRLRQYVAGFDQQIKSMAGELALLDYWQGLAETARKFEWTRPVLTSDYHLHIKDGRHPSIESIQGRSNYVPNDLHLNSDVRMLLITGPNMAGKSTVLRQTAIIAILAQMGSYVPARESCLGICDRIFSRVGASDNLAQGQSTFMVEMTETARILRQTTRKSLVILDEIGRGTSTFDGLALAWAVVEDLAERHQGIRTLFATHYHELTVLEKKLPCLRNFNIAVKEWKGDIVFLRKLIPGPADKSYGIEVARLAGVPARVVKRASEVLTELEKQRDRKPLKVEIKQPLINPDPIEEYSGEKQAEQKISKELKDIDPDSLTPLEALNILHKWKKEVMPE
ncbi:MAG: DNA mismatch repair protein MutS [Desulfosudaceae bacterium]